MPLFDPVLGKLGSIRRGLGLDPAYSDQSDILKNKKGQFIKFEHIATGAKVDFKAFIDAFGDSYTSNWNSQPAYGRMDDIQTFQNTTRTINIGFKVLASSFEEAKLNMSKISSLINMLYPVYDGEAGETQTIKSAPLIKMSFMNLVKNSGDGTGLLGKMSGLTYSPVLDTGVFQEGNDIFPKHVAISTNFTVIHEESLGWSVSSGETQSEKGDQKIEAVFPQDPKFPYGQVLSTSTDIKITKRKSKSQKNLDNSAKAKQKQITG